MTFDVQPSRILVAGYMGENKLENTLIVGRNRHAYTASDL